MVCSVQATSESNVPAPAPRVYVETYGCSFNVSDGEVMAGLLAREGFVVVDEPAGADAVIVNSCTVKDRTYLDLKKRMSALAGEGSGPAVILAGCAPRVPQQSEHFRGFSQIGPDNLAAVGDVVRASLRGESVVVSKRVHEEARLTLPFRRRNPSIEIVPISKGCLGSCSFCQTVLARGRLRSFPEDQIVSRVEAAVAEGVRHVWLTSQDCGAYGLDCGTNLPRLMRRIARVPGNFRVRVGMANPDLIKLFLPEFVEALAHERFYQFAHIPVQAGSDRVLRDMRRLYTVDDYRRICHALKERMPSLTLATDMIVGFPTETEDDFAATLRLVEELQLPVINRSRFSPRVGTSAARLKLLPSKVVAERSRQLYVQAQAISRADLQTWTDWRGAAWVEELPTTGKAFARNFAYKPIICDGDFEVGQELHVEVDRAEGFHLCGTAGGAASQLLAS